MERQVGTGQRPESIARQPKDGVHLDSVGSILRVRQFLAIAGSRPGKGHPMKIAHLLHYAFRARDPEKLGHFYAELFEGQFFLHPVMTGLGIILVKLGQPEALFRGLLEFWPWNVVWDSPSAVFRQVEPHPSSTSYGHLAVKTQLGQDAILAELDRRGIAYRIEPRGPVLMIPTIDDPEGNMIELFPAIEHMEVPPEALCSPDRAAAAIAMLQKRFADRAAGHPAEAGYSLQFMS
jgi:hypothetical protein